MCPRRLLLFVCLLHNCAIAQLRNYVDPMLRRTRVTVKVIEGKDLLVSDLPTGTSDPVVLLWVGSCQEGDIDLRKDKRVQVNSTAIMACSLTTNTGEMTGGDCTMAKNSLKSMRFSYRRLVQL